MSIVSDVTSHLQNYNFRDGPFIITVVGNIGAGKSHTIRKIYEELTAVGIPCHALEEPVDMWLKPHNYLVDTEQNSFYKPISQGYVFTTMMNRFIPYKDFKGVLLIERSIANGIYVFSFDEKNHKTRHFYRELGRFEREAGFDLMINISCSLSDCVQQINHRNRDGELKVTDMSEYLTELEHRHRDFMAFAEYFAKEKIITVCNSMSYDSLEQMQIDRSLFTTIMSRLPVDDVSSYEDTDTDLSEDSVFEEDHECCDTAL